jgi:hypothetical protein
MHRSVKIQVKGLALVAAVASVLVLGAALPAHAASVSFDAKRDCDNNAVVNCGAMTVDELIQKYSADASTQTIYTHFGISAEEVADMATTAVAGKVTKDGKVMVGDKEVATEALTAGRIDMAGSTATTEGNVTFYKRAPSVSFLSDSLDAFVVMKDDVFQFAVIASCGNPVSGKGKEKPTPPPAPEQPKPAPTPETPKPEAPKPETPAPAPVPEALPETGLGTTVAGVFTAITAGSAAAHQVFVRRRKLSA